MRRLVAPILCLVLLAPACTGDDDDGGDRPGATATSTTALPIEGGTLTVGLEGEIDGFDPTQHAFTVSGMSAALAVFDPLLTHDEDGEVVPYLASSLSGNEEGTSWTLALRPGVQFSDGTPLTASAVVTLFDRHLASQLTRQSLRGLLSISAPDDLTVELRTEPWPELPELLTGQVGLVSSPTMTDTRVPVGTGPFVLLEWEPGTRMVFEKNESYWRADVGLPRLDGLELRPIPDSAERVGLLVRGDLDVIHVGDDDGLELLRSTSGVPVTELADGARERVLLLNPDDELFDAIECRRAVASRLDADIEAAECADDLRFTVRTDAPDTVVDELLERWDGAGIDAAVERVDAARLALDELLGDYQAIVRLDDGLLDIGRLDGSRPTDAEVTSVVIAMIPWAFGTAEDVAGVPGALTLPGGRGEVLPTPGIIVPAALHRTR